MIDHNLAAACGLYCGTCEYLGDKCNGCGNIKGKPFWTLQYSVDVCPLYGCCVDDKKLEHCGLCDEFPCETFLDMSDPSLSDEQAEKALQIRKNDLLLRAKIGTQKWLDGKA